MSWNVRIKIKNNNNNNNNSSQRELGPPVYLYVVFLTSLWCSAELYTKRAECRRIFQNS